MANFSYHSLQKSLYEALTDDGTLMGMISGVFDRTPQGKNYPYVTLGEGSASDSSTKTTQGMEYSVQLQVWSREGGRRQAAQIMENIYRILHDVNLTLEGHRLVSLRFISSTISIKSDGWTYQGAMRFRAVTEAL
jgi:hypothetical protein